MGRELSYEEHAKGAAKIIAPSPLIAPHELRLESADIKCNSHVQPVYSSPEENDKVKSTDSQVYIN
jgi:hypothetical protein